MGPILYQKRSIQELVDNGEGDGVWHTSMPIDSKMDLESVLKDKVKAFLSKKKAAIEKNILHDCR